VSWWASDLVFVYVFFTRDKKPLLELRKGDLVCINKVFLLGTLVMLINKQSNTIAFLLLSKLLVLQAVREHQ